MGVAVSDGELAVDVVVMAVVEEDEALAVVLTIGAMIVRVTKMEWEAECSNDECPADLEAVAIVSVIAIAVWMIDMDAIVNVAEVVAVLADAGDHSGVVTAMSATDVTTIAAAVVLELEIDVIHATIEHLIMFRVHQA